MERKASLAACTIVARNYLSYARVLARSFRAHHPDSRFYLLVVDGIPEGEPAVEGVEVLSGNELGLPHFFDMCFKYDVTELSTAVKPTLLRRLMDDHGEERICYLDPDIMVTRPMRELEDLLGRSDIVLTPHVSKPIPLDGKAPSEQDILIAGAYNLGFIALRKSATANDLLLWWEERLADLCRVDPSNGLMVDQRWIDLVPALFPATALLRDNTYNVGYWNLHERTVGWDGERFTVNGRPLAFYHFSGFSASRPDVLSKHQSRTQLEAGAPLSRLFEIYREQQLQCGYERCSAWEYGFSAFDNGVRLNPWLRQVYLALDESRRRSFGNPFSTEGTRSFFHWATEPMPDGRNLSPFLERVYGVRYDVAAAFPDVSNGHRQQFLEWARTQGAMEMNYDHRLVAESGEAPTAVEVDPIEAVQATELPAVELLAENVAPSEEPIHSDLAMGVNICGYLLNESGVGAAARGYVEALRFLGVPTRLKDVSDLSVNRSEDRTFDSFDSEHPHPVNLVCVNADQHYVVMGRHEEFFRNRYNIATWWWELPSFPPQWRDRFGHYNEIWAGTSFVANTLALVSPIPVVRIPPVLPSIAGGSRSRGRKAIGAAPEEFVFLFIFDFHSYFERKNPLALIDAFTSAFSAKEPARLVIKCVNASTATAQFQRMKERARSHRVTILSDYVSRGEMSDLVYACDAYASLHRSEGLGLTLMEAMSAGKPVIATEWSGNTDFMDVTNSYPVRFDLAEIKRDVGPYKAGQIWANPSVEHAAEQMRRVVDDRDEARRRARQGQRHVRSAYSVESVAAIVAERLAVVEQRRRIADGRPAPAPVRPWGNAHLIRQIRSTVNKHVPAGETVLVISKGDELLLDLRGRNAWHFPRNEEGRYAGYYPADSQGAIDHLEHLHRAGAGYLVIPETSRWWLEHYEGFRQHLESNHRLLAASPACHLYSLGQPSPTPSPSEGTGQPAITELRERLEQLCQRMDELHDAVARRSPTSAAKHAPPQRASTTRRRANALKTPTRRLTRKP